MSKQIALDIYLNADIQQRDIQVSIDGNQRDLGIGIDNSMSSVKDFAKIRVKTVDEWSEYLQYVVPKNYIIVYSDLNQKDGKDVPGIKVGDGETELQDLPFVIGGEDYEVLINKPQINGNELIGNKTTRQLGIEVTDPMTNMEIESIFQSVFTEG